jgi:hypothetical protein
VEGCYENSDISQVFHKWKLLLKFIKINPVRIWAKRLAQLFHRREYANGQIGTWSKSSTSLTTREIQTKPQ